MAKDDLCGVCDEPLENYKTVRCVSCRKSRLHLDCKIHGGYCEDCLQGGPPEGAEQ